eukprot:gene17187-8728_t
MVTSVQESAAGIGCGKDLSEGDQVGSRSCLVADSLGVRRRGGAALWRRRGGRLQVGDGARVVEWLRLQLKRIPDDLMDLPSQAICCELAGIFPPEDLDRFDEFFRGTQWPISTLKAVYEIVADKRLIACILDNGPPIKIILFDRIGSDENETGEVFDMPVGTILSTRNLATYDLERCFASQE